MLSRPAVLASRSVPRVAWIVCIAWALCLASTASGGNVNNGFTNNAVGGISIDVNGIVTDARREDVDTLRRYLLGSVPAVPEPMAPAVELRKISLRGLEAAITDAVENKNGVLPDAVKYLGGLQRIHFILVYPEQQDIVLAGPAEGWRVADNGTVVGKTTGRPVLLLDDLLVALRTVNAAREGGISCSIDPTPEGRRALEAFLTSQRAFNPSVPTRIEQAMGMQTISLTGVPGNSHFARVMVTADYRMKQIAMKLTPSPVAGLPSFLDLLQSSRAGLSNMMPRWWLACNYAPLARSEDGLVWQLRGAGVKVLTEDDIIGADGAVAESGRKNPVAEKWAEKMTEVYDELSTSDAIFGQLRNLMDLCVVAAVIAREDLLDRAGLQLPLLTAPHSLMMVDSWNAPRGVPTRCSFVKQGRTYVLTASGGVQIESWQVAGRFQVVGDLAEFLRAAPHAGPDVWWWN